MLNMSNLLNSYVQNQTNAEDLKVHDSCANIAMLNQQMVKSGKKYKMGKWNKLEDRMLEEAIQLYGEKSWRNISNYL